MLDHVSVEGRNENYPASGPFLSERTQKQNQINCLLGDGGEEIKSVLIFRKLSINFI